MLFSLANMATPLVWFTIKQNRYENSSSYKTVEVVNIITVIFVRFQPGFSYWDYLRCVLTSSCVKEADFKAFSEVLCSINSHTGRPCVLILRAECSRLISFSERCKGYGVYSSSELSCSAHWGLKLKFYPIFSCLVGKSDRLLYPPQPLT